jgi:hypothetical protein
LEHWKAVDYVIRFEGELPFAMLLARLSIGGSLDDVQVLSCRDMAGRVRETERAGLITGLDTLPMPDWDMLEGINAMRFDYRPNVSCDEAWICGPTIHR